MYNFEYKNPVKIIFGKDTISKVAAEVPKNAKILMTYGGGSIMKTGVYDQVMNALKGVKLLEFGGIEANPHYETCMKAVEIVKKEKVDFLLSVGGGSVLDATKFIAAAALYQKGDPWDNPISILARGSAYGRRAAPRCRSSTGCTGMSPRSSPIPNSASATLSAGDTVPAARAPRSSARSSVRTTK
jgi:hypothetical protein